MVNGYTATYGSEPSSRKTSLEMTAEENSEVQNILRDEQYEEENERQSEMVDGNRGSGGWWNSLGNTDSAPTPTTATFHHVENVRELGDGFISLMDHPALSMVPNATALSLHRVESTFEDEGDDLGLGNSAHKGTQEEPARVPEEDKPPTAPVQDPTKDDAKRGGLS